MDFPEPTLFGDHQTHIIPSPLLRLPLEIRRLIFSFSLFQHRSITPKEYYEENSSGSNGDPPSPLLWASKQTRAEAFDLLQNDHSFTLRLTPWGGYFDTLSISCLIAQQRPINFSSLPELTVEIWAPYPERALEVIWIWKHARNLCGELRRVGPMPKLRIRFVDCSIAQWCVDGRSQSLINEGKVWNDLYQLVTLFSYVYGVSQAQIDLPESSNFDMHLRPWADRVIEAMEKDGEIASMVSLASCTNGEFEERMQRANNAAAEWERQWQELGD